MPCHASAWSTDPSGNQAASGASLALSARTVSYLQQMTNPDSPLALLLKLLVGFLVDSIGPIFISLPPVGPWSPSMPFRAKVKKAFRGGKKNSDESNSPPRRTDIEYYKPGEIPPSKYRGPRNQKHQDKLHAFSFEDAFRDRKASIPSAYSPGGTAAQSRGSSWVSRARSSFSGKSEREDAGAGRRKSHASHVGQLVENAEDDADVGNVGLSTPATATEHRNSEEANKLAMEKTYAQGIGKEEEESGQLFTPEELSEAMTAATIKADQ